MILLFLVLATLGVVFGVAAAVTGKAEGLSDEPQDLASVGIPRDRSMTSEDVLGLRFALALRGYRMDEVDDALDRLAAEINARDEALVQLRAELDAAQARLAGDTVRDPIGDDAGEQAAPAFAAPDVTAPFVAAPAVPERSPFARPVEPEPEPEPDPEPDPEPEPAQAPRPPAWVARTADDYLPSDATGDLPAGTPVDPAPPAPEAPAEPDPATPEFVEPPANPFRPEVPEIPTYDPWAVTPRSRYTEGPTYVEVEHDDDADPVDAIAEHQTGYAPAPPDATVATPAQADDDADEDPDEDDPPPPQPPAPPQPPTEPRPWQS